jgi:hypothetical protein
LANKKRSRLATCVPVAPLKLASAGNSDRGRPAGRSWYGATDAARL